MSSRISEVDLVCKRIIGAYKNTSLSSDENLSIIFDRMEDLSARLTKAINPQKALSELEEKDANRDDALRALYHTLKGVLLSKKAPIRNAGLEMIAVFKPFELSIVDESYAVESSFINSLLEDYAAPEKAAAIALIPRCGECIEDLTIAQREFEEAGVRYGEVKTQEDKQSSASKIKVEILELCNSILIPYLGSISNLKQEMYGDFANNVNLYVVQSNELVRKRQNKSNPDE